MAVQIRGKKLQVSDTGLIAMTLRYFCDSEDDALFGIPDSYRGLIRRGHNGGEWDADEDKWVVDVTYQGLSGDTPPESSDQFEVSGEFREEPIESFPDRAMLTSTYGAYVDPTDGRLKFPEKMPAAQAGTGFGSTQSSQDNPLFGLTSYPVYYEVAQHTYARLTVPGDVITKRGTIIQNLPSGFEYDGPARAWFVDAPLRRKVGSAWTITERYKEISQLKAFNALMSIISAGR